MKKSIINHIPHMDWRLPSDGLGSLFLFAVDFVKLVLQIQQVQYFRWHSVRWQTISWISSHMCLKYACRSWVLSFGRSTQEIAIKADKHGGK
jgi:hypothetical protein